MPIRKFGLVAEGLRSFADVRLAEPGAITREDLLRVHTEEYVEAIRSGEPRALAESQKFPWSPELFKSVSLTNGGCLAAAREALRTGVSSALASGFHHSHSDHGEGFCTFNGLVVTIDALKANAEVERVAILDLDLHYGNGTAALAVNRSYMTVLSVYGNDYRNNVPYRDVTIRQHQDGTNHFSVSLPAGCNGGKLNETLNEHLPRLLEQGTPDLLLYQAGADPLQDDPYSPLALNHADLKERDRIVFAWARGLGIPLAWVLAGGYTRDIAKVVEVHLNTFRAALEVYR
ncbi:MAG TPA: histone deacetylase [Candidatus Saccharimonadales bacterium]|nr:histone deacetylase [Candidatus Saccharimonadales bacterium]